MSLYELWKNYIEDNSKTEEDQNEFWRKYCLEETVLYQKILENKIQVITGKVEDLAKENSMLLPQFMGFLDGINDSLENPLDLETTELETEINIKINFEKLYKNMLSVPAEWLYNLEEWDNVLSKGERVVIRKEYKSSKTVVNDVKVGRNESCPCGSGKKYKKCCGK
jgi:hypothetical protein